MMDPVFSRVRTRPVAGLPAAGPLPGRLFTSGLFTSGLFTSGLFTSIAHSPARLEAQFLGRLGLPGRGGSWHRQGSGLASKGLLAILQGVGLPVAILPVVGLLLTGLLLPVVLTALWAGGCSYRLDSPRLPNNAGTLGLASVRNRTFTGELDVRLQHRLRSLLLRHPGFQMGQPEHTDLVLDIEVTALNIFRARDLASTNLTSVTYQMVGYVSLYDRRSSQYFFNRQSVVSSAHQDFDAPVTETPAIRDEGLDEAIESFARQVEYLLFSGF